MPVGTNGRAAMLLSGGIDSPVAGYMMSKRGLELVAIHFFSYPYTSERAKEKVIELAEIMTAYTGRMPLLVVPFTKIQEAIRDNCHEELFTLIMRRFMMRIAEKLAVREGCGGLITGESLGQVASQTMPAMAVTGAVCSLPVFRPVIGMDKEEIVQIARKIGTFETSILPYSQTMPAMAVTGAVCSLPVFRPVIGMDKEEIVQIARKIGTFETSILPYEDCCTVFTPKHPNTKPKMPKILEAESHLDIVQIARKIGTFETSILPYEDCCTVFTPKHPNTKPKMPKILEAESHLDVDQIARKIGTFETSILPYEDCCTVFTPKHPNTKPKMPKILEAESHLDVDTLVEEAVSGTEVIYPGKKK